MTSLLIWAMGVLAIGFVPTSANIGLIQANNLYTADFVSDFLNLFSTDQLELMGYAVFDSTVPLWSVSVNIASVYGHDITGQIGFEYQRYKSDAAITVTDLCNDAVNIEHAHFEPFHVNATSKTAWLDHEEFIAETGVWITAIHVCLDPVHHLLGREHLNVAIRQRTRNTLGHLGGEYLIAMPFLLATTLIYCVFGMVWAYWACRHKSNWSPSVHRVLTIGIVLAVLESSAHFAHYKHYNAHGATSRILLVLSTFYAVTLSLYSRLVLILISSGYGIVTRSMKHGTLRFMMLYGAAFLIIHSTLKFIEMDFLNGDYSASLHMYHVVAVLQALCDCIVCWAVIEHLLDIGEHLTALNTMLKVKIYIKFFAVLVGCVALSACAIAGNVWIQHNRMWSDPMFWSTTWFFREGLWRAMSLVASIAIMVIWKPQRHLLEYEELTQGQLCRSTENAVPIRRRSEVNEKLSVPSDFAEILSSDSDFDTIPSVTGEEAESSAGGACSFTYQYPPRGNTPDIENFLRFKKDTTN